MPNESGRELVDLARGIRLYVEAQQPGLALSQLGALEKLIGTSEDEELRKAYTVLVRRVREAIGRGG